MAAIGVIPDSVIEEQPIVESKPGDEAVEAEEPVTEQEKLEPADMNAAVYVEEDILEAVDAAAAQKRNRKRRRELVYNEEAGAVGQVPLGLSRWESDLRDGSTYHSALAWLAGRCAPSAT